MAVGAGAMVGMRVGGGARVAVGLGGAVGSAVGVGSGVGTSVAVGIGVGAAVGVGAGGGVKVGVGWTVAVGGGVGTDVAVAIGLGETVEESVGKAVGATVASGPGDSARSGFTGTAASLAEVLDSSGGAKSGIDWVGIDRVGIAAGPQDKASRKTAANVHVFMNLGSAQNVVSGKNSLLQGILHKI